MSRIVYGTALFVGRDYVGSLVLQRQYPPPILPMCDLAYRLLEKTLFIADNNIMNFQLYPTSFTGVILFLH